MIAAQSTVTLTSGQIRVISDVILTNAQIDTQYLGSATVSPAVTALGVKLKGYGNLKNLDVANDNTEFAAGQMRMA